MRISDWSSDVCSSDLTPFVLSMSKHRFFFDAAKKGRPFDKLRANGLCSRRLCETPAGALCQSRVGSHQIREEAFVRFAQLGERDLMVAARQFADDAVLDRAAAGIYQPVGAARGVEEIGEAGVADGAHDGQTRV